MKKLETFIHVNSHSHIPCSLFHIINFHTLEILYINKKQYINNEHTNFTFEKLWRPSWDAILKMLNGVEFPSSLISLCIP